jgi:hypothetical protein
LIFSLGLLFLKNLNKGNTISHDTSQKNNYQY